MCLLRSARLSTPVIVDSTNCLSITKFTPSLKKLISEIYSGADVTLLSCVNMGSPDVDVASIEIRNVTDDINIVRH